MTCWRSECRNGCYYPAMCSEPKPSHPCPECTAGKHAACNGQAWDHERDESGVCSCWVARHEESGQNRMV